MHIRKLGMSILMAAGALVLMATAFPETATDLGEGQAIVTILPRQGVKTPISILQQDLQIKVNGKKSSITGWVPLRGSESNLELVILIDDSIRNSLGRQLGEIARFIQNLPANVKVALSYMDAGRADSTGLFSIDHAEVASKLRIPKGNCGSNGSPYFCLSDLAKHWPSQDRSAQREAVLITDGVDSQYGLSDQEDPYVEAAIADSVRAGLVVHSICWAGCSRGRSKTLSENPDGGLMLNVTRATGGDYCCEGNGEPVSLSPCFGGIEWRLQNQYRLGFHSGLNGRPEVQGIEIKVGNPTVKVYAPQRVFVAPMNGK